MRRFLLPILLLILLTQGPLWTYSAPTAEGARKLTDGAALASLQAWSAGDQILARAESNKQTVLQIDARTGAVTAGAARVQVQRTEPERLVVTVERTTHRLELDGRVIYESDAEILGRPTLAPDGSWLVVTRYPRGNETAAYGDLWRYDIPADRWLRLTGSGVEEISPVISPDGQQVAVLRAGDLWLLPANRTSQERLGDPEPDARPMVIESHEPVEKIRVKHGPEGNNCREIPEDHPPDEDWIVELPFEAYLKRVVPAETPRGWHPEALKAQAVAARTYAWRYVLADPDAEYHVTDTTRHQYMCDKTYESTDNAVEATRGQHLAYNGNLIPALYSARNSSPTKQNLWGHSYLNAVVDPPQFGTLRRGHGQGYSQWGGKAWADNGWSYLQILRHYYTGAQIVPAAGSELVLLDFANRPATYSPESPYIRGSALYLEANANNVEETRARDWAQVGGTWQIGAWQSGRRNATAWQHLFDLRHLPDLPHDAYRVELSTPDTPSGQRPVLRLGIDRSRPLLDAFPRWDQELPNGETTIVDVTYQAHDELSGLERLGWGLRGWHREAEALEAEPSIFDPTAHGGQAVRLASGDTRTITFPEIEVPPMTYRVWFRLRTNQVATDTRVATLRLFDDHEEPLQRGVRYLRAADFPSTDWEWFYVDVDNTTNYTANGTSTAGYNAYRIRPKIEVHGYQQLDVDHIIATIHPNRLSYDQRVAVTLPEHLTFYATDHAGNVIFLECSIRGRTTGSSSTSTASPSTGHQLYLPLAMAIKASNNEPRCVPFH